MRFVANDGRFVSRRVERMADIVVEMRGLVAARRNLVHVEVVDAGACGGEVREARLFHRLAYRHPSHVAVTVGMAARLKPSLELPMVQEDDGRGVGIDDPRGARHVPCNIRAFEAIFVRRYERAQAIAHVTLARIGRLVGVEFDEQDAPVPADLGDTKLVRRNLAGRCDYRRSRASRATSAAITRAVIFADIMTAGVPPPGCVFAPTR